jgi:hypothetical protein
MGLLEDRLMQAAEKAEKREGGTSGSGARGSSLGSIVKSKIRTQHQKVEEEEAEQDKK